MRRSARIGCSLAIAVLLTPVGPGWTRVATAQGADPGSAAGTQDDATMSQAATPGAAATIKTGPPASSKATGAKQTVTPKVASTAKRPTAPAKKPAIAAKPATKPATTGGPSAASAERDSVAHPRTLDEINIQGEIPVPQVLFITARDQRRFLDFQHRRYLKNSQRIGETTALPSWIAVTPGTRPQEAPR